jgi:heptosyltransferase-3
VDVTTYLDRGSLLEAFTAAAGLPTLSDAPVMHLPPDVKRAIDEHSLPSRFLAIHVRSNDRSRSWPNERWSELIARVSSRWALPVVEVGLAPPLQPDTADFRSLCGRLSVAETAEVIRRCSFFIGVDSGPAHMANAWRRPALLLFGRFAGRDDWCPFDGYFAETSDAVILRHVGPLWELSVYEVMARLDADPRWRSAVTSTPTP